MAALPDREPLPRYLAPLPEWLENLGLRLAWPIVAVNLVGTAFGFWYYRFQFGYEPIAAWPVVPDSPMATLFIALSLATWKLGQSREWLNSLAFYGCIKLGLWTPFVLLVFRAGFSDLHPAMYHFLLWSHLAMVLEAFIIHRYADFSVAGIAVAVVWFGVNDLVDYFLPLGGTLHHTWIPPQFVGGGIAHPSPAHEYTAAVAVFLTLAATALALATRSYKREAQGGEGTGP